MLAKRFLKTTLVLESDSQLDESEECDGRDSSVPESDWADGVTYPNPCLSDPSSWVAFFLARKVAKGCTFLFQSLNLLHDIDHIPSSSSYSVLTAHNERIVGVLDLLQSLWT